MTSTTYSQDMCAVLSQSGREDIYDLSSQDMAGRSSDSQTSQIRREERDTALWPGGIKDKPGTQRNPRHCVASMEESGLVGRAEAHSHRG